MGKLDFRYAKETDAALILDFIKGLAEYEKMLDEVIATEDLLKEWIFEKKKAEVIFALEDEKRWDLHSFSITFQHSSVALEYT